MEMFKMQILKNERGVSAILVAVVIFVLLGFSAFAVDIVNVLVAKNELKNAADAGALAGALELYEDTGTAVNDDGYTRQEDGVWVNGANRIAHDTAEENQSQKTLVEVNWTTGNTGDVQRGHWSFGLGALDRGFYPNDSIEPTELWNKTEEDLDADTSFINAVQAVARREATPVVNFFARFLGRDEPFQVQAKAVAYIGFAGSLNPGDVDQPIAICMDSIRVEDEYQCNIGRMLNSGSSDATHNTAGWTNFSQPCHTADADEMAGLVCSEIGNPDTITYGEGIGATGGVQQSTFDQLRDCWWEAADSDDPDDIPDEPWELTLPVITCPGNNVSNCADLMGAVTLNIIWITEGGTDPQYIKVPTKMGNWECSVPEDGLLCWNEFVEEFNLKNVDDEVAPYAKKSVYFLPDCTPHEPSGGTGGENFGVLAKIPVLVD